MQRENREPERRLHLPNSNTNIKLCCQKQPFASKAAALFPRRHGLVRDNEEDSGRLAPPARRGFPPTARSL